jgi:8-oxo-dGTP pyrophosphatase MutT (NUDIX family)
VAVIAVTEQGEVLFVEQYRHAYRQVSRELPAGVIEPGETPLAAAQRELREETGYVAEEWLSVVDFLPEPNRCATRAYFFLARGARRVGEQQPDITEQIRVVQVDAALVTEEITSGRVQHGVHVAALLFAVQRGLLPNGV